MQIRKSAEDYLEAILVLSKQGGGVRSIDIATMNTLRMILSVCS